MRATAIGTAITLAAMLMAGDKRLRPVPATPLHPLPPAALYRLMTWLSPAFPVGAFAYSSGIEWAVEAGDIKDAATLRGWLETLLSDGSGLSDAILFAHAHRAASTGNVAALANVAELAAAFVPTRERHLETTSQGRAFVEAAVAAWPCPTLAQLRSCWQGPVAYPVAVAVVCAGHDVAVEPALHAFVAAVAANWVSAAVRLVPLGQTDGQRVIGALQDAVAGTASKALGATLDDLGGATFRADIASIRHETQYTRLFRS